jgi:hypothetical protein
VEYVETVIVIIQKVVKRVLTIVGHVQHLILVEMDSAMPQQKHVLVAQEIVEIVPQLHTVGMEHVTLMKIVGRVQVIALDPVHALMEKCEMIQMYV